MLEEQAAALFKPKECPTFFFKQWTGNYVITSYEEDRKVSL